MSACLGRVVVSSQSVFNVDFRREILFTEATAPLRAVASRNGELISSSGMTTAPRRLLHIRPPKQANAMGLLGYHQVSNHAANVSRNGGNVQNCLAYPLFALIDNLPPVTNPLRQYHASRTCGRHRRIWCPVALQTCRGNIDSAPST